MMSDQPETPIDPAEWGLKETPRRDESDKRGIGARVPAVVADKWGRHVAEVARAHRITKGNAAAAGLLIAAAHLAEWHELAGRIAADSGTGQSDAAGGDLDAVS